MQVPLTVRHVFDFGDDHALVGDDLVRPASWDALRTQTSGPFALEVDRKAWEVAATARDDIVGRADAAAAWLDLIGCRSVASYGVGTGYFEYLLWRAGPHRPFMIGDYAPQATEHLAKLFAEADVRQHDLLADAPFPADIQIFHRVDTEFTREQWRMIFNRFAGERVLLIAEVASLSRLVQERLARHVNRRASRAGWSRNEAAVTRLWTGTHTSTRMSFGDLIAWDLQPAA